MANPASSILGPHKDRTLLFLIDSVGKLGVNQYTDETDTWDTNGCPVSAVLPTPNHISAVYTNGLVKVYGMIRNEPVQTPPTYTISELSPTVRFVASSTKDKTSMTTTLDKLAVVTDEKRLSWFYFLKKQSAAGAVDLKVSYLNQGNPWSHGTVGLDVAPAADSQLAAVYLPETNTRVVFYQVDGKKIRAATISDSQTKDQVVDNSDIALQSTPLAVDYTGGEKDRVLYLYYLSNVKQLNRATGTWNGSWWVFDNQSTILGTTKKALGETQLTVTSEPNGTNRLFFINAEEDIYGQLSDTQITKSGM